MLIARVYPHYRSQEVIAQSEILSQAVIEESIDGFSVAKLEISMLPGMDTWCKIELYEVGNTEDRLVFRGNIYELKPLWQRWNMLAIVARGEKALLHQRKALKEYKFTNKTISAIVTELLQNYNTEYNEDWGFETWNDESLTLEVGVGDDYYDIFDEICEQKELFWEVEDGIISFKKSGNDLRDTQILEYDWLSHNPGNITNIELIGTATGGNVVLVEDSNGKKTIDKSQFSGLLTGVVSKQIRKGDNAEKAKQFAREQARPQRKYQIQVANGSIEAKVWDKIKVEVVNTNSFYDYQWDAMVQSKVITYANASKVVQYGIEEFMVSPFSWETWVEVVEKSIKLLRQRKGGGETPAPQVDLSWYATSSAVSSAVQWVAQTAQTALNAANQAKQTAESKADANHNHDDRYYTESEIDNKLSGKADVNHTHNFPTSLPASDVYERAKQINKPTYTISEIQGLQEALDNKSSSVASLDRIDFNYTTNLTQKKFRIGSRHQFSNVPHNQGGHQLQVLWWDLQPQGTGDDGGWGLMFWPDQNPYLQMQGVHTYLGRTDWWIKPKNWINPPNHMGVHREANSDRAQIVFNSNNNDDTTLDFKLGDDNSEFFRFMHTDTWRAAFNYELATFKQKFFAHAQFGEFPTISLAIWDSDTGFNWNGDGNFTMKANGADLNHFYNGRAPIVRQGMNNGEIKNLTKDAYANENKRSEVIYMVDKEWVFIGDKQIASCWGGGLDLIAVDKTIVWDASGTRTAPSDWLLFFQWEWGETRYWSAKAYINEVDVINLLLFSHENLIARNLHYGLGIIKVRKWDITLRTTSWNYGQYKGKIILKYFIPS